MTAAKLVIAPLVGIGLLTLLTVFGLHRGSVTSASAQDIETSIGIGVAGISGFVIQSVEPGSPAEQNGIRPGDVIVSLDGRPVKSAQDMGEVFRNSLTTPDKLVEVVFLRYDPSLNRLVDHTCKAKPIIRSQEVNASPHRTISAGVLDGKATTKPDPIYPEEAKAARASGDVIVRIIVNEDGRVEKAEAVSGHPLLQKAAVDAAYKARFSPSTVSGQPVKLIGVLTYNFVLP
jgi:TonB family protein